MICGGTGSVNPANEQIQEIVNNVKDQIHSNVGKTYPKLAAVNYKSQVVAGTNYFIKVDVGNDEHIHLKVYQALTHTGARPQLTSVQTGKSSVDAVEYF